MEHTVEYFVLQGQIKYGVISRADLEADLMNWTTLYLAGRLQKPVKILECDQDIKIMMKRSVSEQD